LGDPPTPGRNNKRFTLLCASTAARNFCATSPASSWSRFFVVSWRPIPGPHQHIVINPLDQLPSERIE